MSRIFLFYLASVRRALGRSLPVAAIACSLLSPGLPALAQDAPAPQAGLSSNQSIDQLKQQVQQSLDRIDALQKQLDADQTGTGFQQQLDAERAHLEAIQKSLDEALAKQQADGLSSGRGSEVTPKAATGLTAADIYRNGFFVSTEDKSYSMFVNGLFQVRYTGFKPDAGVQSLGESSQGTNTFDVFLGRLALSGSVVNPNLQYFLQFQGSTAGNSSNIAMLDWFTSDTLSKYLTVQAGRSWIPYTYEYYDNPGNYLFADLSTAEYAFVLQRAIGVQAYGQAGKLSYAALIANSIPALDVGGQENFNSKLAYVGHVQYDILAPYGYVETDPTGSAKQELTFWASAAYNPIAYSSGMENLTAGDTTVNATSTIGYRYKLFTLQPTGYYRKTTPVSGAKVNNSWGYSEQAGYYLVPKRFEFAERLSGVNWGAPDYDAGAPIPTAPNLPVDNTWYAGPGFSYHRIDEDSVGLNYYLHGHNAKIQMSYTYLHGNTFAGRTFSANRVWVQSQIMF